MITQLERLSQMADGRYATDAELLFLEEYIQSFSLRVQTYRQIQASEAELLEQVQHRIRQVDPALLLSNQTDLSGKWKRDTIRVLRYSAITVLLDDAELLRDRLLFWMQTVMKAFDAQRSCNVTYHVMQQVVQSLFPLDEASLLCPILELNRSLLGAKPE
ncbi:phycobilisome protein [Desertifilum sp. FACHB-1129]|uniref:Phycobilisome protein n=1 Tax=Desertifilum tharense IPPAS B-1220 TaxID=1781255 RepID=A0A1E5QLW8_9CYAN|nr:MULTISPECIES: phycobilisome protein [Desertifilum]MDA0212002.1 phycobilisome protein [Cyanobacteria bacterium FC1]MBD2313272.1 phycobilisome protein [Desertifilum sp. FACHB-1129]MBD2324267.1 phycobilisome protein [Desertifilum sp. FACHB-866]MBD2334282.1 phycobilisome protein [Desertifilum sp. FACHB-868]OEJ75584.1 phycobilisome protein [Desertifilum tharense IPPAS B-1220]